MKRKSVRVMKAYFFGFKFHARSPYERTSTYRFFHYFSYFSFTWCRKQKQEEEVKKANRIILATKCSIIRNAQIAEKNEIAREFHNENLRLEKIMLEERDKALIEEELKREQERKSLLEYSKEIRKQLEERELIRAKEVERIEEEAIAMKKSLDAMEKVGVNAGVGICGKVM